ncbi:hypothetical protein FNV43_RR20609 [Rhamnella rubrinervis]|uniref:Uncharacterized protein n=1 Tax=Rhamnella rubrinervis TaxID=2594499 RepID=A0A8K0E0P1_9ROSA|nr:hypothetical protein FNV43_RR20609 [Rhamnella rubrinervis]
MGIGGVCGHPWCDNGRRPPCRRSAAVNGGRRRRNSKNSGDGGIFPKGVARFWDPHAMMVGNVRPEHGTGKRPRYRVWVRCWGLECAWGSEGDASCGGGATLLVRCWGLSSGALREAPYGWSLVLGLRHALLSRRASQSNPRSPLPMPCARHVLLPRHAKPVVAFERGCVFNLWPLGCGGIVDAVVACVMPSGAGLAPIDSFACLAPCFGHRTACARSLSALCYGDLVSLERLGFLCCIPNVMELVANGVPFLSVLCKGTGRTSKWHTRPRRPLKIILWPPRSSCAYSSPRMRNTWAWAFMAFRTSSIALSLVLHDCRARCGPSTPAALGSRGIGIKECYLVDPASSHMLVSKIKPCMYKRSTRALPVALMIHDNSADRTALVRRRIIQISALSTFDGRIVAYYGGDGRTTAKAFAKDVFINQERKLGARRRSDTVLVSTINDADQGSADVAYRTPPAPYEKSKSLGSGGSMVARLKLKGIDGRAPPGVEPAA